MSDDYKKDLAIDFHSMDKNWINHSANYMEWGEKWANAVAQRDRAKERLDVVKAELGKEIRTKAQETKTKITEAGINEEVILNSKYQEATNNVINTNEKVNIFYTTKTAFEHNKSALENMSRLMINGYWSEPSIPQEAKEKVYKQTLSDKLNENQRLAKRKVIKK